MQIVVPGPSQEREWLHHCFALPQHVKDFLWLLCCDRYLIHKRTICENQLRPCCRLKRIQYSNPSKHFQTVRSQLTAMYCYVLLLSSPFPTSINWGRVGFLPRRARNLGPFIPDMPMPSRSRSIELHGKIAQNRPLPFAEPPVPKWITCWHYQDWVPIRSIPSCSFCCHSISVAVDWGLVKKSWSRSRLPPRHRDLRKNHPCPNNKLNQENKISQAFCIKIYFNTFFVLQTLPSVWCPGQDMPLQAKGLAPLWMPSLSQLLAIWIPWHLPPLMWAVNFEKAMIVGVLL